MPRSRRPIPAVLESRCHPAAAELMPDMSAAEETLTPKHEEDIVASQSRTMQAGAEVEEEEFLVRSGGEATQPQPRVRYPAVEVDYLKDFEEE